MTLTFNAHGAKKKELIKAIEEINNEKAKYQGVPSCAYKIGECLVTKQGNVETEDENLAADLKEYGFEFEHPLEIIEKKLSKAPSIDSEIKGNALTLSFPWDGFDKASYTKLTQLVEAKKRLISAAFNTRNPVVQADEESIKFSWFKSDATEDEKLAYILFLKKLMETAKNQKRVTAKEKEVENEKYAFRCFLLKLGFIGDDYKGARKILLQNLSGSSAFKNK